MATKSPSSDGGQAVDAAVQRITELNERIVESTKSSGQAALDAYETALQSMLEFQEKAAEATQLDWVSNIAAAYAKFVQDVSTAFVAAARQALK